MNLRVKGGILRLSPTSQIESQKEPNLWVIALIILGIMALAGSCDRWSDPRNESEYNANN